MLHSFAEFNTVQSIYHTQRNVTLLAVVGSLTLFPIRANFTIRLIYLVLIFSMKVLPYYSMAVTVEGINRILSSTDLHNWKKGTCKSVGIEIV